jgi:hypothetical protein
MNSVPLDKDYDESRIGLAEIWSEFRHLNGVELALRLTVIMMLVYPGQGSAVSISVRIMGMIAAVSSTARRSTTFWFVVFLLHFTLQNIRHWYESDNHNFLISYWYLALACSFTSPSPVRAISLNGRLLIGLTFLLATISKLFTPEYVSENTFRYLLFTDPRFGEVATVLGGLDRIPREISPQQQMHDLKPKVAFPNVPSVNRLARVLTWWTLLIEAGIATFFLFPKLRPFPQVHHLLLLVFVITVYPIAPVLAFAMILLTMGIAQCDSSQVMCRMCYLATFIGMQLFATRYFVGTAFAALAKLLG